MSDLGGDYSVVGEPLRDVGLSAGGWHFLSDIHCPAVHPVLLPCTLHRQRERDREKEREGLFIYLLANKILLPFNFLPSATV